MPDHPVTAVQASALLLAPSAIAIEDLNCGFDQD
jgi:hypothetical protein